MDAKFKMDEKLRAMVIQKIAVKAMAGLLANPENHKADWNQIAKDALTYAQSIYVLFEDEFGENVIIFD